MATYGIVLFYPGMPAGDELMLSHVLAQPITFTAGLPGSQATAKTAATAEAAFSIQYDGVEVGTCTFPAAGTTGTYAATADFTVDTAESFDIVAPSVADATLSDISFTIQGKVASSCCNTIRVDMTSEATLGVRLTNIPRPRVQFNARAVTMGRLTNA